MSGNRGTHKTNVKIAIIFILIFSCVSQAKNCLEYMTFGKAKYGPYAPNPKGTLTKEDRILIDKIEQNHPGATAEKWNDIGEIYFEARIKNVPEIGRDLLQDRWNRLQPSYNNEGIMSATSEGISLPAELERTPLGAILQAHEFEHVVQIWSPFLVRARQNTIIRTLQKVRHYLNKKGTKAHNYLNPLFLYQNEKTAMEAEWEIASIISPQAASETIGIVNRMSTNRELREFLKFVVTLGTFSKEDYIKAQHIVNRYSFKASVKATAPNWFSVAGVTVCWLAVFFGH